MEVRLYFEGRRPTFPKPEETGFARLLSVFKGARCRSVVRSFTHGAIGRRIDPS